MAEAKKSEKKGKAEKQEKEEKPEKEAEKEAEKPQQAEKAVKVEKIEVPEKLAAEQLALLEKAKKDGKIKIGVNEVTKAVERGTAKLVLVAEDVEPAEITMHLPVICKEKGIPISYVKTRKELGEKAGIEVGTTAAVIIEGGEARKELQDTIKKISELSK